VSKKSRETQAGNKEDNHDDSVDAISNVPSVARNANNSMDVLFPSSHVDNIATNYSPIPLLSGGSNPIDLVAAAADLDLGMSEIDDYDAFADAFAQEGSPIESNNELNNLNPVVCTLEPEAAVSVTIESLPSSIVEKYHPNYFLSSEGVASIPPSGSGGGRRWRPKIEQQTRRQWRRKLIDCCDYNIMVVWGR